MKLVVASDHRGYELKEYLKKYFDVIDLGTNSSKSVDYPDYGFKLGEYVTKHNTLGVAICGSGIGISIACNKVKGVRCARVNSIKDAIITRKDNNANILALSSTINKERAIKIINAFLNEKASNEERHIKRIKKIEEYENTN